MAGETESSHALAHGSPQIKRRRIGVACSACRTRKTKCDGRRPTCNSCEALSLECAYELSDSSSNVFLPKDYLEGMEKRLKQAEEALLRHDNLLLEHLSDFSHGVRDGMPPPDAADSIGGIRVDAAGIEESTVEDARTDGLAITFISEHSSAFYGESSNVAFARYLLKASSESGAVKQFEELAAAGGERRDQNSHVMSLREPPPVTIEDHGPVSPLAGTNLPNDSEMERLLSIYFANTGSLFPFIHEQTFWQTYNEFKATKFTRCKRTWIGILNMLFAMASSIDLRSTISNKEQHKTPHIYYARAVVLCDESSRQSISIEIVHYLLLVVLYLQGAQRSTQTWSVHGLLVRTATALGLHSERSGQRLDPVQRETRRRTWLTIFCLDKVLSVSFGRPPSIHDDQMGIGPAVPWLSPATSSTSGQNASQDLSTEFLNISVDLYKIMGHSLTKQYSSNLGRVTDDIDVISAVQTVSEVRHELKRWVSALPTRFDITLFRQSTFLGSSPQSKLQTILTLRHHHLNILIHRPLLSTTLRLLSTRENRSNNAPPYTVQLAMAEAQEGIKSAESTIDIVHSILQMDRSSSNNLGIWFFTLYYVFTASLVISGRDLWSRYAESPSRDDTMASGRSYLTKAVQALELLDSGILLVQNCAKYIRFLSKLSEGQREFSKTSHSGDLAEVSHPTGTSQISFEGRDVYPNHETIRPAYGVEQETLTQLDAMAAMPEMSDFMGNNAEAGPFFGAEDFGVSFLDAFNDHIDI